jgi:adenylate kinase
MQIPKPLLDRIEGAHKDSAAQRQGKVRLRTYYRQLYSTAHPLGAGERKLVALKMLDEVQKLGIPRLDYFVAGLLEKEKGKGFVSDAKEKAAPGGRRRKHAAPALPPAPVAAEEVIQEAASQPVQETPVQAEAEIPPSPSEPDEAETEAAPAEAEPETEPEPQAVETPLVAGVRILMGSVHTWHPEIILMAGRPGAGKTTQAHRLQSEIPGIIDLNVDRLVRMRAVKDDELGLGIKLAMKGGVHAVGDELILRALSERMVKPDCRAGFVLDDFPRNTHQAISLHDMLAENGVEITHVFELEVAEQSIPERYAGRRVCDICAEVYHTVHRPGTSGGSLCNSRLHRGQLVPVEGDANPIAIDARIKTYRNLGEPLMEYYRSRNLVTAIAEQPVHDMHEQVMRAIRLQPGR